MSVVEEPGGDIQTVGEDAPLLPNSENVRRSSPWTRRQKLTLVVFAITDFCSSVVFSSLAPFFPQEAYQKGATDIEVGLIFGSVMLVQFIASPIIGYYLVRLGPRFTYLWGVFLSGCTTIIFGFVNQAPNGWMFVGTCFAVRVVEAIGGSMYTTASFAILSHTFPDHVATVIGLLETFLGLGIMAGPALGGALYQLGGFKLPFISLGAILLVSSCFALKILPLQEEDAPSQTVAKRRTLSLLCFPNVAIVCFTVIMQSISFSFLDPTLQPFLAENFHLNPFHIGLLFLCGTVMYTLLAPGWGWLADKFPKYCLHMMIAGGVGAAISYFFLAPSPLISEYLTPHIWLVAVALGVDGLSGGGQSIPTFKYCLNSVIDRDLPDNFETHGMVSGIFNSAFALGAFIGPVLGAPLASRTSFAWCCTMVSFLNLFLVLVMLVFAIVQSCKRSGSQQSYAEIE